MTNLESDAFVFFGATGDLAYRQIFPALQALIRRGDFEIPIIGVAKSAMDLDALRAARTRASRNTAAWIFARLQRCRRICSM